MNSCQGMDKKRKYFEGWYFKHQVGNETVILIPGICVKGKSMLSFLTRSSIPASTEPDFSSYEDKYAFIQVITNDNTYNICYSMSECYFSKDKLYIKIGENIFSKKGIKVNIQSNNINLKGMVKYEGITPIRYPIMGPFLYVPFMECKHEVISMHHKLKGKLVYNGMNITFDNGTGYIEKDLGHSFPKTYLWLQCNNFQNQDCSIMVSIADIPYLGYEFKGCICAIHYNGFEFRLATYLGVKIETYNEKEIYLRQGRYVLKIHINDTPDAQDMNLDESQENKILSSSHKIFAPSCGVMSRSIGEQIFCQIRVRFYEGNRMLFDLNSSYANIEIVK